METVIQIAVDLIAMRFEMQSRGGRSVCAVYVNMKHMNDEYLPQNAKLALRPMELMRSTVDGKYFGHS